ncbi:MAG: hypothetical protein SCK70_08120 [bacterium]|nr:hypothetical protein [bacterium]
MAAKNFISWSLVILILLFSLNCQSNKKQLWNPEVAEYNVTGLKKPVTEIKNNLNDYQKLLKSGQRTKANEKLKLIQQGIENLEFYYYPLLNVRANLTNAYHHFTRKEIEPAKVKLNTIKTEINFTKTKVNGNRLRDLNSILLDINTLEKQIDAKSNQANEQFIKVAKKVDLLIGKKI